MPSNIVKTLFVATVCLISTTVTMRASGTPAEPFIPILEDIKAELPGGVVIRLPTQAALNGVQDPHHASVDSYEAGELRINIHSAPDCMARFCQRGYFKTVASGFFQPTLDYIEAAEIGRAPITLADGVVGQYITVEGIPGPFSIVVWEQDQQLYLVSVPTAAADRQESRQRLLDFAISMANEDPITNE